MTTEWQSIDTAPQDGQKILGFDGEDYLVIEWDKPMGNFPGKWLPSVQWWDGFSDFHPTHWMPLPEPPEPTP